ncbi:MAG: restriction endonuclease subunit S [Candidatus Gracilibacteria bacterium]|jgi:type I restriction enzyme S subunit
MPNKTTIPAGWKIAKAFECIDVRDGTHATPKPVVDGIPLITSKNIIEGKLTLSDFYNVSNEDAREINKRSQVVIGDILISMIGTVGATAIIKNEPNFVVKNVGIFKTGSKAILSSFLIKQFHSKYLQNKIQSLSSGGIQKFISLGQLRKLPILFPPLPEQEKIVEVLEAWDSYLEKLSNTIKLKKKIKKGLMQKLLAGKIRLKGFSESWKTVKIGDCLKIKHGKSQKAVEDPNGQYPILGTGGEMGRATAFLYDRPSVLIGRKGTINKPKYMETPFWTVDTLFYSEVKDNCYPKYLYYHFLMINWKQYNEGSGIPSLSASTISSIKIEISKSFEEQTAIAQILTTADQEIEALEKKKAIIEQQKKYLLNNLITGKIRLPEFIE